MDLSNIIYDLKQSSIEYDRFLTEKNLNLVTEIKEKKINFNSKIPEKIFIVPYRNRGPHKLFFTRYIKYVLEDETNYKIFFVHQNDKRSFNRGAMKNIGFIEMKKMYPKDYKNITFIFNDIDTMPCDKNILPYNAEKKVVEHYFGFDFALGGIFAIKGEDFENINGFPNFWGWGFEDNTLNDRFLKYGGRIDRKIFYKLGDMAILHFNDMNGNYKKRYTPNSLVRSKNDDGIDGIKTIKNLKTEINGNMINVNDFLTRYSVESEPFYEVQDSQRYKVPNRILDKNSLIQEQKKIHITSDNNNNTKSMPFQGNIINKRNLNTSNFMGLKK